MAESLREALKEIDQSTDWVGMQKVGRAVAPSIAPTVGAIAATAILGPWLGPIVGGMAGEAFNNAINLTQPSIYGYAAQALVPPSLRGITNVTKLWPKFGTTSRGAETLQQVGKADIRLMQKQYQPWTSSEELFSRVGNELIPMPHAKEAADKILQRIESELPSDRPLFRHSGESAKEVKSLFKEERLVKPEDPFYPEDLGRYTIEMRPGAGGLQASRFQTAMHTLGERLRAARRGEEHVGGSTNVRNYSQLFGGYARDLDASPILKRARESFKREATLEDIGEAAKVFVKKGVGETEQLSVNRLMNMLKDDNDNLGKFFKQAFDEKERQDILTRLGKINELPGIGPGTGQATGSSRVNPLIAAMMGAGSIGAHEAGVTGALGAAAGTYALSGAGRMARDLSIAWNIPAGRAMIQEMLNKSGGKMTPQITAAIEAFAASQTAQIPRTMDIIKDRHTPHFEVKPVGTSR